MKAIVMDKETESKIVKRLAEKLKKELEDFKFNMNDSKFSFSMDISEEAKEKVTILYSPKAYLRMKMLVNYFNTEVGWYGLVKQMSDKLYYVYDVKVCKQYVNGSKVDTDDKDTLEFFNSLTDEEAEDMHFQAHSHVKMSTTASGIDLQNQADVVRNIGKKGFYIFQIWNKQDDINTYLYDITNNVFYDKKDVVLEVEDDDTTISDWMSEVEELVKEKKIYSCLYDKTGKSKKEEKEETCYLNNYWDGNTIPYERWEW